MFAFGVKSKRQLRSSVNPPLSACAMLPCSSEHNRRISTTTPGPQLCFAVPSPPAILQSDVARQPAVSALVLSSSTTSSGSPGPCLISAQRALGCYIPTLLCKCTTCQYRVESSTHHSKCLPQLVSRPHSTGFATIPSRSDISPYAAIHVTLSQCPSSNQMPLWTTS